MTIATREFRNFCLVNSVKGSWQLKLGKRVLFETPVYIEDSEIWAVRVPDRVFKIEVKRRENNAELAWWQDSMKVMVYGTYTAGTQLNLDFEENCLFSLS